MDESIKRLINRNKNRNIRFVKVKQDRVCEHCKRSTSRGTECLTVNKKLKGRQWYCMECVALRYELVKIRVEKECVPFGDEGGFMALNDFELELQSIYENLEV